MASTTLRDLPGKTMMKMNRACVVGGTGFVASSLVKLLLENGYAVNTTVRDPGIYHRIHLIIFPSLDHNS